MNQANNPQDGNFGLWFGEVTNNSPVKKRILNISALLDNTIPLLK
jgi:hypothetical protein